MKLGKIEDWSILSLFSVSSGTAIEQNRDSTMHWPIILVVCHYSVGEA